MQEYPLTFFEVCEALNRSRKSISRYVRQGRLHPKEMKSAQGTLEYRFSLADIEAFKAMDDFTGQDVTRQEVTAPIEREVIPEKPPVSNEMVPFLMEQIKIKDGVIDTQAKQMTEMIERNRETNILLNKAQDRALELETREK